MVLRTSFCTFCSLCAPQAISFPVRATNLSIQPHFCSGQCHSNAEDLQFRFFFFPVHPFRTLPAHRPSALAEFGSVYVVLPHALDFVLLTACFRALFPFRPASASRLIFKLCCASAQSRFDFMLQTSWYIFQTLCFTSQSNLRIPTTGNFMLHISNPHALLALHVKCSSSELTVRFTTPRHTSTCEPLGAFPFALAYSTTFHTCEGLAFDSVGISLTLPVFTHGQLYTALLRVRCTLKICVRTGENSATNIT